MKKLWKYLTKAVSTATLVITYLPLIKNEVENCTGFVKLFIEKLLKIWQE